MKITPDTLKPSRFLKKLGGVFVFSSPPSEFELKHPEWGLFRLNRTQEKPIEIFIDELLSLCEADARSIVFNQCRSRVVEHETGENQDDPTPLRFNREFDFIEPFVPCEKEFIFIENKEWRKAANEMIFPDFDGGASEIRYFVKVSDDQLCVVLTRRGVVSIPSSYCPFYFRRK